MVSEGQEDDDNEEGRAEKEEEDSVAASLKSSLKLAFCGTREGRDGFLGRPQGQGEGRRETVHRGRVFPGAVLPWQALFGVCLCLAMIT